MNNTDAFVLIIAALLCALGALYFQNINSTTLTNVYDELYKLWGFRITITSSCIFMFVLVAQTVKHAVVSLIQSVKEFN